MIASICNIGMKQTTFSDAVFLLALYGLPPPPPPPPHTHTTHITWEVDWGVLYRHKTPSLIAACMTVETFSCMALAISNGVK